MASSTEEGTPWGFESELIDLGAVSLRALRTLDSPALRRALRQVVQETTQPIANVTTCSDVNGYD